MLMFINRAAIPGMDKKFSSPHPPDEPRSLGDKEVGTLS
jgi:hypothetical protein